MSRQPDYVPVIDGPERLAAIECMRLLHLRFDILTHLNDRPMTKPELVEESDGSRSTIDRSISDLELYGFVRRTTKGRYAATAMGIVSFREYISFIEVMRGILRVGELLELVDVDYLPSEFLSGMEPSVGHRAIPVSNLTPLVEQIDNVTEISLMLDIGNISLINVIREQLVSTDATLHILAEEDLIEQLCDLPSDEMELLRRNEQTRITPLEYEIPFTLWVIDSSRPSTGFILHEHGAIRGLLVNKYESAVQWGRQLFREILTE